MPDYITIRTAQNVDIQHRLAGLGSRVMARLLDMIIIIGYMVMVATILVQLNITGWGIMAFYLPVMCYTVLWETLNKGQTPGKNIMRIRTVSKDGSPTRISQFIMRWLLLTVDLWVTSGLAGLISTGASDHQQRLGDLAASTVVIGTNNKSRLSKTAYRKTEEGYTPVYPQASTLSDQDVRIIQKVLADRSDHKFKLMTTAAERISKILGIEKEGSSKSFLTTIVKDYNYYLNSKHDELYDEYE